MSVPDNNLDGLERQRLELEGNILELQKSIYHWRSWEAEYDGIREEINALHESATTEEFLQVSDGFDGALVDAEELKVLFGAKQGVSRTKEQVVGLLARRIDYVQQNITTMEKRLRAAEDQLAALNSIEQQLTEAEAEFPVTEIIEELDEEGNVISSSTSNPGDQASQLLEMLQKAGVKDIPELPRSDTEAPSSQETPTTKNREGNDSSSEQAAAETLVLEDSENTQALHVEDATSASMDSSSEHHEELPVTDINESPEDAELRRQMLQYGLNEVGAVVAELELDEDASDISLDGEYDDYDFDEEGEEEDEYGRTTGQILGQDYHQQMRELEAKLNARGMFNMGKDTSALPAEMLQELETEAVVETDKANDKTDKALQPKKPKKKVAFATELDIAPAKPPVSGEKEAPSPRQADVTVLSDSIVERTEPAEKTSLTTEPPKKASRFKSVRKVAADTPNGDSTALAIPSINKPHPTEPQSTTRKPGPGPSPSSLPLFPAKPTEPKPFSQPISDITEKPSVHNPPSNKILADTVLERAVSEGSATAPEADELDEQLHKKEIATEFYKMRNQRIQQNGGFLNDEEPAIQPIETEDSPQRVSKFRAARMNQSS